MGHNTLELDIKEWLGSEELRSCSPAARGLWLDLLCLMHPEGLLKFGNKPMSIRRIAKNTESSIEEVVALLNELDEVGILKRNTGGCIYSPRMVKKAKIRAARSAAGKRGGMKSATSRTYKKPLPPSKQPPTTEEIKEVLDYLNEISGKKYQLTPTARRFISGRLTHFSVEDCKRVIDVKYKEWHGTKMWRYFRISTLFNATKFEEYVNETAPKSIDEQLEEAFKE